MNKYSTALLALAILAAISGCAFWDGFTRGLSDANGEVILGTAGEVAGKTVKNSVPLLPSPWREIVVGCLAAVTGWVASAKKKRTVR